MEAIIRLDDVLARRLGAASPEELSESALHSLLAEAYRRERVGRREVGEVLGLDRWQTEKFLADHDALRTYSLEDFFRPHESRASWRLMIVVVADSGPVRYLAVLNLLDLFPKLFDRIILPRSVIDELRHPHAPAEVRAWAENLPNWVELRQAHRIELANVLDAGEAEAIALAEELHADLVLLDEREARKLASERGLIVTGTIGILERAATRDLIIFPEVLRRLVATNFRIAPAVLREALERDARLRQARQTQYPERGS